MITSQPGWVQAVQDACIALDAAGRWWLDQRDLDDRTLFVWHEIGEIRTELGRHLDLDDDSIQPGRGSDPARALRVAADHLAAAVDRLDDPGLAVALTAYQARLGRLGDRVRR